MAYSSSDESEEESQPEVYWASAPAPRLRAALESAKLASASSRAASDCSTSAQRTRSLPVTSTSTAVKALPRTRSAGTAARRRQVTNEESVVPAMPQEELDRLNELARRLREREAQKATASASASTSGAAKRDGKKALKRTGTASSASTASLRPDDLGAQKPTRSASTLSSRSTSISTVETAPSRRTSASTVASTSTGGAGKRAASAAPAPASRPKSPKRRKVEPKKSGSVLLMGSPFRPSPSPELEVPARVVEPARRKPWDTSAAPVSASVAAKEPAKNDSRDEFDDDFFSHDSHSFELALTQLPLPVAAAGDDEVPDSQGQEVAPLFNEGRRRSLKPGSVGVRTAFRFVGN